MPTLKRSKTVIHDVGFGDSRFKIESRPGIGGNVYVLLDANFVTGHGRTFCRRPGYWSLAYATFEKAYDEAARRHEEAGGSFHD